MIEKRRIPWLFLIMSGAWVASTAIPSMLYSKVTVHLFLNSLHSPAADLFFAWITNLGDGWTVVPVVLILLLFSYRASLVMSVANILCGVASQALKRFLFTDLVRPSKYFEGVAVLHTVPGVELYAFHSFPSGHAATVFATCTVLVFRSSSRAQQLLLWSAAVAVAFSRVYLSQHFLGDVSAGSALGILIGTVTVLAADWWTRRRPSAHWLQRGILKPPTPH